MISKTYFSPGKLLITSEYFVLDGSIALAVPTILGQEMKVSEISNDENLIIWEALHESQEWFNVKIDYKNWQILESNVPSSAEFILNIFKEINILSNAKFSKNTSYHFKTNLEFPSNFGLGSSSTLMNNLAQWSNVNPFLLNEKSLGGSGYDVAVAVENSSILFQKKTDENVVQKVDFNPLFLDKLILIHLNHKQDSREGIEFYRSKIKSSKLIHEFSALTLKILECKEIEDFSILMELHESKLSKFLGLESVKSKLFADCPVFVKSLGAWGGDFVLSRKFPGYKNYFSIKNFSKVFDFKALVSVK
ncbi:MAG: 30S ribosomal protein S6 [Chryseobacterium sp.]|nr:30S ribosomal protein S6 [Chryseobacterium sp.]